MAHSYHHSHSALIPAEGDLFQTLECYTPAHEVSLKKLNHPTKSISCTRKTARSDCPTTKCWSRVMLSLSSRQLNPEALPHALPPSQPYHSAAQVDRPLNKTVQREGSFPASLRRLYHHFGSSTSSRDKVPPAPRRDKAHSCKNDILASNTRSSSPKSWLPTPPTPRASSSRPHSPYSTSLKSSASASSSIFPLDPDFEVELDIALEMAPHELGSAWSQDSYNAMQYLRARTPYPPTMTETAFDYHKQLDRSANSPNDGDRWKSALEIGCGPGQMSIHLATRFHKVYGQDPSPNMLKLANTVKHMSPEDLADVRLPPVQDPERIEYLEARGEDPVLPAGEKVDLIMMASCIHWMDWETPESSRANWTKWASVLKPGGTLVVVGGRPIIGPYTGEEGDQIRPLRDWLLDFPTHSPEINRYYGASQMQEDLRTGGLYRKLPMPWDYSPALASLWDRTSYTWIPIDDCTVLGEAATSSRLSRVDDPEHFAATLNNLPNWLQPGVRRAVYCDNSGGDLVVSTTTPRKMADWVRSTSAYLKYLGDNPEQKKLSLQDEDWAAVEIKKICKQARIKFDQEIECHHSGAILCIRRTEQEC